MVGLHGSPEQTLASQWLDGATLVELPSFGLLFLT